MRVEVCVCVCIYILHYVPLNVAVLLNITDACRISSAYRATLVGPT